MSAIPCIQCGRPIPSTSKMAEVSVAEIEAQQKNWAGRANPDGTVTVTMCFQCQINRAEAAKQRS